MQNSAQFGNKFNQSILRDFLSRFAGAAQLSWPDLLVQPNFRGLKMQHFPLKRGYSVFSIISGMQNSAQFGNKFNQSILRDFLSSPVSEINHE
jgi:hypothetical protein